LPFALSETCKLTTASIRKPTFADVHHKLVNLWPASRLDELIALGPGRPERSSNKLRGVTLRIAAAGPPPKNNKIIAVRAVRSEGPLTVEGWPSGLKKGSGLENGSWFVAA